MKTFISFFIAAVIIGLLLFLVLYWIFKMELKDAKIAAISAACAGFVVDYVREYTNSRKRNRVKEH